MRRLIDYLAAFSVFLRCILVSAPLVAQADSTTVARPREQRLCWRGRPAPACRSFWITEFGYDVVIASTSTRTVYSDGFSNSYRDLDSRLVWTIGPMINRDNGRAVGGTLTLGPGQDGTRAAIEGRYRRWTTSGGGSSLDLSGGIVREDVFVARGGNGTAYGPTVSVFLIGGDLVELTARTELLLGQGKPRAGMTVGFGLGSYAAAGGTVAFVALVAALFASIRYD
jgi:hypothetical protein